MLTSRIFESKEGKNLVRTYHYTLQTHSIYNWRRIAISIVRKARNLKISLGRARISWSNFKKNLHIQKHHRNENHEASNYNTTRWITVNKIIALGSVQKSNLFYIFRLIHKRDNFFGRHKVEVQQLLIECWTAFTLYCIHFDCKWFRNVHPQHFTRILFYSFFSYYDKKNSSSRVVV